MSPIRASGGASALKGSPWIIVSAARVCCRSSAKVMFPASSWIAAVRPGCASVVGILEGGLPVVVEGADAFDPVWMDGRPPVGFHHDRDGLLGRLPLAQADGPLDRLDGCGGVAGDLVRDPACHLHQLAWGAEFVDHAQPVGLLGGDR